MLEGHVRVLVRRIVRLQTDVVVCVAIGEGPLSALDVSEAL